MAYPHHIRDAFNALGQLFADEHAEQDDRGAAQVQNMTRLLRQFQTDEQAEHKQDIPGGV